jgi:hypothetical protein
MHSAIAQRVRPRPLDNYRKLPIIRDTRTTEFDEELVDEAAQVREDWPSISREGPYLKGHYPILHWYFALSVRLRR